MLRFALVALALLLLSGCGAERRPAANEGQRVSGHGLSVALLPGWHGDVTKPEPNAAPLLQIATFPISGLASDLGRRAQAGLGPRDILISVVDYGRLPDPSALPAAARPIRVTASDVASFEGFREPVVTRSFRLEGHALQLWVVSGAPAASHELLERANEALATLAVVARRTGLDGFSVEVPDGWTGFSKDLDNGPDLAPTVVVANVPWRDDAQNLAHVTTTAQFERLPPDAIVIAATAGRYRVGDSDHDPNAPVRLSDGHFIADEYEGQPAPHVAVQVVSRPLGSRWVSALVYFGRNDPTLGMRAQADAVLSSLELR